MEIKAKTQKTGEPKEPKIINCLYSYFKDSLKPLKIVCDWDEVIQSHEPYAGYLAMLEKSEKNRPFWIKYKRIDFATYFNNFWQEDKINYSPYGSRLKEVNERQQEIKNSPNFYQEAPFLTIAKELLMLIRENKIKKIIFLTVYDKRKFPQSDPRKPEIFKETFGKFPNCSLQLIGFDSDMDMNQIQGANKTDWIKQNASDFDIVIDDNPLICGSIIKNIPKIKVIAPYYPAVVEKHHLNVILVKTSVSDWEKKDFNFKYN